MQALQGRHGCVLKQPGGNPRTGARYKGFGNKPAAGRRGGGRSFEDHVAGDQPGDQAQHQQGFGGVLLAVTRRHGVARRFEDRAADDEDHRSHQHEAAGYVLERRVDMPQAAAEPRQHESVEYADEYQRQGANGEDDKPGEQQNVQDARQQVPRMFVLSQPELDGGGHPLGRSSETRIGGRLAKRQDAPQHDIRKDRDANQRDGGKKPGSGQSEIEGLCRRDQR